MKCLNCQAETNNPKFCSRSCFVSYSNKRKPRRKPKERFCKYCGELIELERYETTGAVKPKKVCNKCNRNKVDWYSKRKIDIQNLRSFQINSRIRTLARDEYRRGKLPRYCKICGYNLHVEVCHIKSIESFSPDATIGEINTLTNLVALCPNHHWEFDNGLLKI